MKADLAEIRRNASVCGCSSMVEQKLPKLAASAENPTRQSKTRHETSVWNQTVGFRGQNSCAPPDCNPARRGTSEHRRL